MTRTLLLLILSCACFQAGYNNGLHKVLRDDVFGDATVQEIATANETWKGK